MDTHFLRLGVEDRCLLWDLVANVMWFMLCVLFVMCRRRREETAVDQNTGEVTSAMCAVLTVQDVYLRYVFLGVDDLWWFRSPPYTIDCIALSNLCLFTPDLSTHTVPLWDSRFHLWSHGLMVEASFLMVYCPWETYLLTRQEVLIDSRNAKISVLTRIYKPKGTNIISWPHPSSWM